MKQEKKKRVYLSIKLLWKVAREFEAQFFDTDDGDDIKQFLEYVESYMKSAHK